MDRIYRHGLNSYSKYIILVQYIYYVLGMEPNLSMGRQKFKYTKIISHLILNYCVLYLIA